MLIRAILINMKGKWLVICFHRVILDDFIIKINIFASDKLFISSSIGSTYEMKYRGICPFRIKEQY
jgi:hypothetical protein